MHTGQKICCYGDRYGPPTFHSLNAGPVRLVYENGSLRYLKAGNTEILRMIYFAVRDHNWNTIAGSIVNENIFSGEEGFTIDYTSLHKKGEIDISFHCSIRGDKTGHIEFIVDGEATTSFRKNRIGLCVLHPLRECVGKPCLIDHVDGVVSENKFPELISPHQPFRNIRSMTWPVNENMKASISFEGDVFETEDQRNWTDASFKTYGTPLDLPFPVEVRAGQKIHQRVALELIGLVPERDPGDGDQPLTFTINNELEHKVPRLGLCASTVYPKPDDRVCGLIRKLNTDHIRWDLDLEEDNLGKKLQRIAAELSCFETDAFLALFFGENPENEYEHFLEECSDLTAHIRYMVLFSKRHKTTPDYLPELLADRIRKDFPGTRIGGGTNAYFAELNRERINPRNLDFIVYSVNPQVHAFDHASLAETPEALNHGVKSARHIFPGKEIMVSPITLKPRFNPNATGPEPLPRPGELPSRVDPRQMSLYGAAWFLVSLKHLAEAGIEKMTAFETAGWLGIMQGPEDPPEPSLFRAKKGDVFPLYLVFAWMNEIRASRLLRSVSSSPLVFNGLACRKNDWVHVLLANLSHSAQEVSIKDAGGPFRMRTLSSKNVYEFMQSQDPTGMDAALEVNRIRLPACSISLVTFKEKITE